MILFGVSDFMHLHRYYFNNDTIGDAMLARDRHVEEIESIIAGW